MKKAISLLLTVILIIGLFTMNTVNAVSEFKNTDAVYHISYNGTPDWSGCWLSKDYWETTEDMSVTISFDYYLIGSAKLGVYKGEQSWALQDNDTGSEYLKPGENKFTYTTDSFSFTGWGADLLYPYIANRGTDGYAELYIWNVKVIRNGQDVTDVGGVNSNTITCEPVKYEEVLNLKPVHHINYNGTPDWGVCWLSKDYWGTTADMSVTISFDYYLSGSATLGVYKYLEQSPLKDNATGTEILQPGENTFTYTTDSFSFTGWGADLLFPCIANRGAEGYADLYIWNVRVIRNGSDITDVSVGSETVTSDILTYGELNNEIIPYYHINYSGTPDWSGCWLSKDYWGTTADMSVTISFDYYLSGNAKLGVYKGQQSWSLKDEVTGDEYLQQGRNTFTYTTDSFSFTGWGADLLYPYIANRTADGCADLYIWNVKVIRNGVNVTNVGYVDSETITCENVKYKDVANLKEEVYELDFSETSLYTLSNIESLGWYNTNTSVTILFDYYLSNAQDGELIVQDNASAIGYNHVATNDNKLYAGRHSFCFNTDNFKHNTRGCLSLGIKLSNETLASNAKLYIINPKIIVKTNDGTTQDKFGLGAKLSSILSEYNAIPNKGDSNNDGILNVLDFITINKHIADSDVYVDIKNTNVNDDIAIDTSDLVAIKKMLLGIDIRTKNTTAMKNIICWGDSITHGMAMADNEKYPAVLDGFLGEEYNVLNCGSSGESAYEIASRQGAYKVYTSNDIVFNVGEKTIQINDGNGNGFRLEDGSPITFNLQEAIGKCELSVKKVYINGVEYRLSYEYTGDEEKLYLNRTSTTGSLTIPAGTELIFDSAIKQPDNYCEIFYMGANGGFDGAEGYVQRYKDMIERHGNDRYIIILPTWTTIYDHALITAFGDRTVNLKSGEDILRVMETMGIEPTEADMVDINQNLLPISLSYNNQRHDVHLSKYGYHYMATMVYEKGVELGYWK